MPSVCRAADGHPCGGAAFSSPMPLRVAVAVVRVLPAAVGAAVVKP